MGGLPLELAPLRFCARRVWHLASHLLSMRVYNSTDFTSLAAWEQICMRFPMANPDSSEWRILSCMLGLWAPSKRPWGHWHISIHSTWYSYLCCWTTPLGQRPPIILDQPQNFEHPIYVSYPKSLSRMKEVCMAIHPRSCYYWSHKCKLGGVGLWFDTKCSFINTTCFRCTTNVKLMHYPCDVLGSNLLDNLGVPWHTIVPTKYKHEDCHVMWRFTVGSIVLKIQSHFPLYAKLLVERLCMKDDNVFASCEATRNLGWPYDHKSQWSTCLRVPKVYNICHKHSHPWSTRGRMATIRSVWLEVSWCKIILWSHIKIHPHVLHFNQSRFMLITNQKPLGVHEMHGRPWGE